MSPEGAGRSRRGSRLGGSRQSILHVRRQGPYGRGPFRLSDSARGLGWDPSDLGPPWCRPRC